MKKIAIFCALVACLMVAFTMPLWAGPPGVQISQEDSNTKLPKFTQVNSRGNTTIQNADPEWFGRSGGIDKSPPIKRNQQYQPSATYEMTRDWDGRWHLFVSWEIWGEYLFGKKNPFGR